MRYVSPHLHTTSLFSGFRPYEGVIDNIKFMSHYRSQKVPSKFVVEL